mgnify:CR=1 FL=1
MIGNTMEPFQEVATTMIVECAIFCAIFIFGVFLQVNIIAALKRDQAMAWEMNLAHSIVMIVHWSFKLLVEFVHYIQPTFHEFFGNWFCYLLLAVRSFGIFVMLFHSLYISIHKYVFIIHNETVNRIGDRKTKGGLLWAYLIVLISWTLSYTARGHFSAFGITSKCSIPHTSVDENGFFIDELIENPTSHTFTCGINDPDQKFMENVVVNMVTKLLCSSQNIITFVIALNISEIFFYFSIFRCVLPGFSLVSDGPMVQYMCKWRQIACLYGGAGLAMKCLASWLRINIQGL